MNVLVAYYSQTGNTQQIAEAIHAEVLAQGHDADLRPIDASMPESFDGYDLVFLGAACHSSDLAPPVKAILEGVTPSPSFKLAGFATHATSLSVGGERQRELYDRWAGKCPRSFEQTCREKDIDWCGYFSCQGAPSPPIEAFIHHQIVTEAGEWAAYIAQVRRHPDEEDKARARAFARHVLGC